MTDPPNEEEPTGVQTGAAVVEERYRRIFEHSNDAVMVVDLETETFLEVNPAACEMLGYSREELLGMHPEDIHPNDVDRVREEFISQVYAEGSGFTDDLTCLTKEGEEVPTEISGAALNPDQEGDPSQMIAMLRDISDRVAHRRELEAKVKRLDQFASIVSHDLRNPLSIIKGHATLARETGDSEHFDAIDTAVDRMEEMISELLQLTRAGDLVGERRPVDLETIARDVWEDCELEGACLEVETTATLQADRERLQELLANLFENAAMHGGSNVTVRVGALDGTTTRGFYVADDGPGIPREDRPAVFEWGHTTANSGTGFGLAIVRQIAEAHDWEISVREAAGGGARFEIGRT